MSFDMQPHRDALPPTDAEQRTFTLLIWLADGVNLTPEKHNGTMEGLFTQFLCDKGYAFTDYYGAKRPAEIGAEVASSGELVKFTFDTAGIADVVARELVRAMTPELERYLRHSGVKTLGSAGEFYSTIYTDLDNENIKPGPHGR